MIENPRFFDAEQKWFKAEVDGATVFVPVEPGNRHYNEVTQLGLVIAPYVPPTPPPLDQLVEKAAQEFLEQDLKVKALGLVLADVIERSFGVSKAVARQEVITRFKTYYKGLLEQQPK